MALVVIPDIYQAAAFGVLGTVLSALALEPGALVGMEFDRVGENYFGHRSPL
ncbi:hypothetical protein DGWBC_0336 [Dehalogenimonas sp. WBC-2]|nr:hypothetical protein DGWBC_0336 [Dehalogenimonas sp. WBC-2]